MKKNVLGAVAVLAFAGLGVINSSMAQPGPSHGHPGGKPGVGRDAGGPHGGPPGLQRHGNHAAGPAMARAHDRHDYGRRDHRGAGPQHNVHRGDRLPPEWRNRQYQVSHWREHHLPAPRSGHAWVQLGADYAMIALATGIVAQIVLGH